MDKAEWYLKGLEVFGWRARICKWLIWFFYKLRLISERDVKYYVDTLITAWMIEQAKKKNLKVNFVELED